MRKLLPILSFLLSLAVSSQTTVSYTLKDTTGIDTVLRPGCGLNDYFNITPVINYPNPAVSGHALDMYFRITWDELSKGWSGFDAFFNQAIDRGQKVIFRIVAADDSYTGNTVSGFRMAYPIAIHNSMQAETNKDYTVGALWFPNWNSTSFLNGWNSIVTSVRSHINTTSRSGILYSKALYAMDIGGIGIYGEGHRFGAGAGGSWPTGTQWTLASLQSMVNIQIAQFPEYPLIGNINFLNTNSELPSGFGSFYLNATNTWGQLGMRWDHVCDIGTYNFEYTNKTTVENGVNFKTEEGRRWMTAPVLGEPQQFNFAAAGQCDYYHSWTEANTYHASMIENANNIENGGAIPTCTANLFRSIAKRMGYRYSLGSTITSDSLIQNGVFNIRATIGNTGIAPTYEKWNWTYELRQGATVIWSGLSTLQLQFYLPGGSTQVDNFTLPSSLGGNHANGYDLYLVIRDPNGYRQPLPLQNTNRFADGSYLLRAGIRIATAGTTPPPPPPPPPNQVPVILMGADQTDSLPKNVDTLTAQISDGNGDVVSYTWTQISGPNTATMVTPTGSVNTSSGIQSILNRITGLIEGTYQFRLSVNDGKGGLASATVNVFVFSTVITPPPPPPPVYNPPTLNTKYSNGRYDTTIVATADSAYLRGHVVTKDTAIQSVQWILFSGGPVTFSAQTDSTTKVTGLIPNGTNVRVYQFYWKVTDKAGNIVTTQSTPNLIIVYPATPPDPIPLPAIPTVLPISGIKKAS